ncbi:ABC transporter permease [Candidatus Uhrbacteria bacterium]|nr:ABC transporter permease [Candidatus Uhrbacteria bacterium]
MLIHLSRVSRYAFQSFWRNLWLSAVIIFVMMLALLSANFFVLTNLFVDTSLSIIEKRINITVNFDTTAPEQDVLAMADRLRAMPQVATVEYVSKEAAKEYMVKKFEKEGNTTIRDSFDELESNPLFSSLIVKARRMEDYPAILAALDLTQNKDLISDKRYDDKRDLIQRIQGFKKKIQGVGTVALIFFTLIAILIVYNTIKLSIYARKKEVQIMKLVGATNWFIRAPLIVEGMIYSIFAVLATILITFPLLGVIQPYMNYFDGQGLDVLAYFSKNFVNIFGTELLIALGISILSSLFAIGRYLKI